MQLLSDFSVFSLPSARMFGAFCSPIVFLSMTGKICYIVYDSYSGFRIAKTCIL